MLKLSNLSDKFYDKYDKFDHNFIFLLEFKKKEVFNISNQMWHNRTRL